MNSELAKNIIYLYQRDEDFRNKLIKDKSLFDGYHPEMQAIHEENAKTLQKIIHKHGWPSEKLVGNKAAEAAWIIVQHAISLPDFQRSCLKYLTQAAEEGKIPLYQPAMLLDRILVFEGKPQIYGTQFDWDDDGKLSPYPISDIKDVDKRRKEVGLPNLSESIESHRRTYKDMPKPENIRQKRKEAEKWAIKTGWRK